MERHARTASSGNTARRLATAGALAVLLTALAPGAYAGPRWVLIYYRQLGNQLNANSLTIETHCFNENGTKAANVGVTNLSNSGSAIFGYTDIYGHNRINPLDVNNCQYDIRIYDPTTPTDQTPAFNWQNQQQSWPQFYSYITWWMKVSDDTRIQAYPQAPVYHYDLVDGVNSASGFINGCIPQNWVEAPGANSDASEYADGGWADYQAQTFVVPDGINRIVGAAAFLIRGGDPPGPKFTMRATIREGSPTGPQVGPATVSREVHSNEFKEVAVCWGVNDVHVTPGETYALRLDATDGLGFNTFRTINNNYPDGQLYNGPTAVPAHDLVAVVSGVAYDFDPPVISVAPDTLAPTVPEGNDAGDQTFGIANGGPGTLTYTISDDADWLSVAPPAGTCTIETDTINVMYNTAGLPDGPHTGTITISAPAASNTPQVVTVNLTVEPSPYAPCDFDKDFDVDLDDYGRFQLCYSGAGRAQPDPDCKGARLDEDDDVDQDDFDRFDACMSGPNVSADPDCAD